MRYLPHTSEEIAAMLAVVGADSLDDLFATVPADCRMTTAWNLPSANAANTANTAKSEWELNDHMRELAGAMRLDDNASILVGARRCRRHIPGTGRSPAETGFH